ncbi:unnamed protein product [Boreogadus saida]
MNPVPSAGRRVVSRLSSHQTAGGNGEERCEERGAVSMAPGPADGRLIYRSAVTGQRESWRRMDWLPPSNKAPLALGPRQNKAPLALGPTNVTHRTPFPAGKDAEEEKSDESSSREAARDWKGTETYTTLNRRPPIGQRNPGFSLLSRCARLISTPVEH